MYCLAIVGLLAVVYVGDISGLDASGFKRRNVCSYTVKEEYTTTVVYYNGYLTKHKLYTRCPAPGGAGQGVCVKEVTIYKSRSSSYPETKSRYVTKYGCCNQWTTLTDSSTECLKPICEIQCKNGGTCSNPNTCSCALGYEGQYCTNEINACRPVTKCQQGCVSLPSLQYKCLCKSGFLLNADLHSCDDIDECVVTPNVCSCKKQDGVCQAICRNLIGSFECVCGNGYFLSSANQCIDKDECQDANLCKWADKCVNTPGSYKCMCAEGETADEENQKCIPNDLCAVNNGGCGEVCRNMDRFRICLCHGKRILNPVNQTCYDPPANVISKTTCESDIFGLLDCQNKVINVLYAMYGRIDQNDCDKTSSNYKCYARTVADKKNEGYAIVDGACDGQHTCFVYSYANFYGDGSLCPGVEKYLEIKYVCV